MTNLDDENYLRELLFELIQGYARCVQVIGMNSTKEVFVAKNPLFEPRTIYIAPPQEGSLGAYMNGGLREGDGGIEYSVLSGDFCLRTELSDRYAYVLLGRAPKDKRLNEILYNGNGQRFEIDKIWIPKKKSVKPVEPLEPEVNFNKDGD